MHDYFPITAHPVVFIPYKMWCHFELHVAVCSWLGLVCLVQLWVWHSEQRKSSQETSKGFCCLLVFCWTHSGSRSHRINPGTKSRDLPHQIENRLIDLDCLLWSTLSPVLCPTAWVDLDSTQLTSFWNTNVHDAKSWEFGAFLKTSYGWIWCGNGQMCVALRSNFVCCQIGV